MADVKTNQAKLYKALQGVGFKDLGSEELFASKLQDSNNRKKLFNALQSQGFKDLGDYDYFEKRIFDGTDVSNGVNGANGKRKQNAVEHASPQTQQPQQQSYQPSWQEQMAFGMNMRSAERVAQDATESYDKTVKNIEEYRKQQPLGSGVAKTAPKLNPETGELEQNYLTSVGGEYQNKYEAEDTQRRINDTYWRKSHPLEAAERENAQDLRDIRMEEERNTQRRREAEGGEPQGWWETFKKNLGASLVSGIAPIGSNVDRDQVEEAMLRSGAYGSERQAIAKERDVIAARRRLAEETQQLLTDIRKDQQMKWGIVRAGEKVLETALNPHTWDFGEADLSTQLSVADAVIKADSGIGISSNEQKLLDTWAKNAAINSEFSDQLSGWTKAGIVTGESLPFMLEMAMNPASGLGEAATSQLVKYSLKKYGTKWVKDHAKSMLAKKIATRLVGDVVGSGIMASTTGMARVAADAERRMTGDVDISIDANGDVIYNGVKQDTKENPGAAIFKAMSATSIENWSEMAGNYLGFINSFFGKALGKSVIGKAGRKMLADTGSIEGVSLNKAQKFIYELAAGKGIGAFNKGLAQFAERTQWHGVIGEYLEEEIGNIANAAIVGDMTFDTAEGTGVFNLQQNIDTFCGVALMGGFMSAMNTVGYAAHRYNYDIDRVSNANSKLFGDDLWSMIKTTIDASISDPRSLNDLLTDYVRGDGGMFDTEGKKAILKYTQAALEKEGGEMANYQPRMSSSTREEVNTEDGKRYVVTSFDKNGDEIIQQSFNTEDDAIAYEGELKMQQQQQDYKDYLSMTNKLGYQEASQVVDEFLGSIGLMGSIGDDAYADAIAAINDPKSELGKQFIKFKQDKIIQKAQANRDAISAFEEENGWTPGTVQWLSEQDPMQLDAEGLEMMDQARSFLEGLAYPSNEVHIEHEQEVGADTARAVVENIISDEEPIDPQNNAGQQIYEQYNNAMNALNELFARNEDFAQEYERLSGMGLSPQEIISSLDSFRPEEVQTIIDYYNAEARHLSFMEEASKQIDSVARRNRERATFKGTLNGQADLSNVYTISDGVNEYFLVSGNVTTDADGKITGSDSGLVIGMDADCSFVQLSDTSGYSVMPSVQTLDQFEEQERIRLQEQVSSVIDPDGALMVETGNDGENVSDVSGETQGNVTDNRIGRSLTEQEANDLISSMEANATVAPEVELTIENWLSQFGEDGKIETPIGEVKMGENQLAKLYSRGRGGYFGMIAPTLQTPDLIIEKNAPSDGAERDSKYLFVKTFIKPDGSRIVHFESVTVKKDGMEVSVSSHEAEAKDVKKDMQNGKILHISDGLSPSSEWSLTGAPRQEGSDLVPTSDNISAGKDTENIGNVQENQQKILDVTDKDGVKRYENGVPVDVAIEDILNDGLDVNETIDLAIGEAQQALDKIKTPKTRAEQVKNAQKRTELQNTIDYYTRMRELVNERDVEDVVNSEETINNQVEQPASVENVVPSQTSQTVEDKKLERIKELKAELGELFDDDFTKANDVYELVSMWVGRKRNLAWDDVNGKRGLQKELGWTRKIGGDTKYIETLLAKNGEGMGVDEFAHMVWESPENSVNGEKRWTDKEIKDALLELLQSAGSKSDVVDYAVNTRERQARAALEAERQRAEEETLNDSGVDAITDEEIANMNANLPFEMPTDEDIPDSQISQLAKEIESLSQQEGMPEIRLLDTDRMTDDEWYDITSGLYGGSFVSQEEIDTIRGNALEYGVVYNENTGEIVVFSGSQTAEDVRNKINDLYEEITKFDTVQEEGRYNGRNDIVAGVEQDSPQGEVAETPAAERTDEATGEGRTGEESVDPLDAIERNAALFRAEQDDIKAQKKERENGNHVSENEAEVRDALVSLMRDAGIDVITDSEEGQRLLDEANGDARLQRVSPVFYSNAERAVEDVKQEKATADQWLAMIQKNGGLKSGEDKWLGLSDWLNERKGQIVTKDEILDFIRKNQIQIEEKSYSENPKGLSELKDEYDSWIHEGGFDYAWNQLHERFGDDADIAFSDLGGELVVSNEHAASVLLDSETPINETRLDYTTEGLENRREIALTVPSIDAWNESDMIHFGDAGYGKAVAWVRFGDTTSPSTDEVTKHVDSFGEPKEIRGNLLYYPNGGDRFSRDYVVYGRLRDGRMAYVLNINERPINAYDSLEEALEGMNAYYREHPQRVNRQEKVLVIDEIQSKRHQEGREHGYRNTDSEQRLQELKDKELEAYDDYTRYVQELQKTHDGYFEDFYPDLTDEERSRVDELQERAEKLSSEYETAALEHSRAVPDAPFSKNWHELAMKRMLRYAAENGYDKIAWTKGNQQAERYNIGGAVDEIVHYDYTDSEGNTSKQVGIHMSNGDKIRLTVDKDGKVVSGGGMVEEGTHLSDVVGKELYQKIMDGQGNDAIVSLYDSDVPAKRIDSDGLRIGGEGMRGFYDQILPRFMDKYGKKWGVKTHEIELPNVEESGRVMHAIDVTDDMKKSVMEGQPMFFRTNNGEAYGYTLNGKIYIDPRIATSETPVHEYHHIWAEALEKANPEAWEHLKEQLFKDEELTNYVKGLYPELANNENALAHEIFAQFGGKRGLERLNQEQARMEEESNGSKSRISAMFDTIRNALSEYWKMARDLFAGNNANLKNMSAEDFADMAISDLLNRVNPENIIKEKELTSGYSEEQTTDETLTESPYKQRIKDHINDVTEKLGSNNITNVIESIDDISDPERRAYIEQAHKEGRKMYGWFENGQVFLYLPDIDSEYKAEQTIWHETVAHVGLRDLIGAENYGKLLNRLWLEHKDKEMGEWVTKRMQTNGWSLHKAIDEWLAREAEKVVAERQGRRTLWQKLAGWVGDMLRELGYRTNPTLTDVRYLFWLSENQLREGEPMSKIKQIAFLHQLERENDVTHGFNGLNRSNDMDAGYSEDIDNPLEQSAKDVYHDRMNRVETVFTEAYQDAMISLKTAQNSIVGDKNIPDSQNAYMAENLMHGKNKNEQDLFNRMFRDPMIETINKIMSITGMNWGDIDRYVYTKHGLERNRELYVRDWLEKERAKEGADIDLLNDIENRWLDAKSAFDKMLFSDYLESLDNFIRNNIDNEYNPSEHDYSGFRAMFGNEDGVYNESDIIADLMNTEDQMEAGNVNELWERINAATKYGLERYREAGMRSDEQIDRIEQMFHWYVPLRGFKEETGEDMFQYFSSKGNQKAYVGGLLKHAKGRGSEANYPISTIFAMSYKAISDCNQNLVNQKLYRLCQAHENDLIVLSDSWAVLNEHTGEWEESYPKLTDDMNEEEVRRATLDFEQQMKDLEKDGKAKKLNGKQQFDYVPMDKAKKSEHVVEVRINGQQKRMTVVGNPRMAQALNGQLRFERGKNVFSKWNASIKNMMASLFTSYSPTFALRNMFRDWTHFRTMLSVREGERYAKSANKYYRQSLFKMVGMFKKYRNGTLDMNNEMERDFKDFMDNGGITGFVQMQKIDDIQKQMEKLYEQQKQGKAIRLNNKLWDYTIGAIEAINEGIENNARFATYRASRHIGSRTRARSAYDAKEITVNFNKKGAGSKTYGFKSQNKRVEDAAKAFGVTSQVLGEGRIFFNATVQAIATTFKNFQHEDGSLNKSYIAKWTSKYAIPPFLFGLALPMINKALASAFGGDDDDPYANLPEWTRRKNLCFYIGNNNFITIPIGQELAAFLSLGDMLAGMTYSPELKPLDKSFDDEIVGIMNTFSPVDVDTKITKGGLMENPISEVAGRTFSVLAPLVAVENNLSWTGRPIYREDRFQNDQYTPEYQMVYSGTNPVLVNASKLLHELGGGDDVTRGKLEVNPAIVQYLWEQYTGGPGKVFSNTISIGKDAKDLLSGSETEFNIRKVEGLKAFVQQGDDRTAYYRTQAKYRKYSEDAEKLYHDVKGYENGASENPMYLLKLEEITKGDDFVRMQIIREADKQLSEINKAANKAEGRERKELHQLYNQSVKEVVDLLDGVGK